MALFFFSSIVCLGPSLEAGDVTVFGNVQWTDSGGANHPVRESDINLFDLDVVGDQLLFISATDDAGDYSITVDNTEEDLSEQDPFLEVRSINPSGMVSSDSTILNIHDHETALIAIDIPDGAHQVDIIIPNSTTAGHAFSVSEALYTIRKYATAVRGAAPGPVTTRFTSTGSFYCETGAEIGCNGVAHEINLVAGDRWDWDVIMHEYGHYLAAIDSLDDSPGGSHAFGVTNITAHGKDKGLRLAWGEGLANYIGLAAQTVASGLGHLPPVPNTGGTVYHDTIDQTVTVDLEGDSGSGVDGEGDETSVMRILWDIADGKNEAHDVISIGHEDLYGVIDDDIAGVSRLEHLWDHFFTTPADLELGAIPDDQKRAQLGDIFQKYDVSPAPTGAAVNGVFDITGAAPTFNWSQGNDSRNDDFVLHLFNDDFSTRLFPTGIDIVGDVSSYTLSAGEWATVKDQGFGAYNWVIAGSDTTDFTTGSYWSGSEVFALIPEPASLTLGLTLLCCGCLAGNRRR